MNEKMKTMIWEVLGYATLLLCVFGQVTVGKWYLIAQFAYLVSNIVGTARDFALGLPWANKVKDACFTGITFALILIRLM